MSAFPAFAASSLLPLIMQLGQYVTSAVQRYGDLRAAGMKVDADILALWLEVQTAEWKPSSSGISLLTDPETRRAGCRFLAGIAYRLAGGQ